VGLKAGHDDDTGGVENHQHDETQQQPMAKTL
jgi:hypothetical protein